LSATNQKGTPLLRKTRKRGSKSTLTFFKGNFRDKKMNNNFSWLRRQPHLERGVGFGCFWILNEEVIKIIQKTQNLLPRFGFEMRKLPF